MEYTRELVEVMIKTAAPKLAKLGSWPSWLQAEESLMSRIPQEDDRAPGFDAGIACALGLMPPNKMRLSAILHAAYTEEAVEQVRREIMPLHPDYPELPSNTETEWWLAACHVCELGGENVTWPEFLKQIEEFKYLIESGGQPRQHAAETELRRMKNRFSLIDGVPFAVEDGGLQGAYIAGHDWGVQYMPHNGLFFIGTFKPSLGLEAFKFSDRKDENGLPMSGPVHGSRQFVKVSSFYELTSAMAIVRKHLNPAL